MGVFLFLAIILLSYRVKIKRADFFDDYIDSDNIQTIKGFFLFLVFMSHFYQYVQLKGALHTPYLLLRRYSGQLIVVPFLFYSGFGVMESIKHKGYEYLSSMPYKRILRTLINFDFAVILFIIVNTFQGRFYPLSRLVKTFIGYESIGNSNWYIFAIVFCYTASFLVFYSFTDYLDKEKQEQYCNTELSFMCILCCLFIYYMSKVRHAYYYDTIFAYVIGMYYSLHRRQIEKRLMHNRAYFFTITFALLIFYTLHSNWTRHIIIYESTAAMFALLLTLITMKVRLRNPIFDYCGRHLFSLYILQRIPMQLLRSTIVGIKRPHVYFILCLILTLILSAIFDLFVKQFWSYWRCNNLRKS